MRLAAWILCGALTAHAQTFSGEGVEKAFGAHAYRFLAEQDGRITVFAKGIGAEERFLPCSTFKLPHALIALECGLGRLERRCDPKACHTNHGRIGLERAVQQSCVSYFRQTARDIGKERMERWLRVLGYPRASFSWTLDGFWLDGGDFTLTPREQLDWIRRFYSEPLRVSPAHLESVRAMSLCRVTATWILHGKTGSSKAGYGWFVGRILQEGCATYVVVCLRGATGAQARSALEGLLAGS